jgi:hypothetical protein
VFRFCFGDATPSVGPLGRVSHRSPLGANPGVTHVLILYLFSSCHHIRFGFCLSLDLSRIVAVDRFVRPQLVSLIFHLQYSRLCSFLFLLVSLILMQELAPWRGQSRSAWLITRGEVVLRLRGSSRVDWKSDRLCDISIKLIVIFT